MRRHWPGLGVLLSICCFALAALNYRGAPGDMGQFEQYDWARDYISTLFAPGSESAGSLARTFAITAMLLLCISMGLVFKTVSIKAPSAALRGGIAIGGTGSMVYAFLAVTTPMHDLLVTIALMFFLVATISILEMLRRSRQTAPLVAGLVCLASLTYCAVIYYGHVHVALLAVAQKLTFALCIGWLLVLHHRGCDTGELEAR